MTRAHEAAVIATVGASNLLLIIRRMTASVLPKILEPKVQVWATIAAPFAVAAIIILGLALLGSDNLAGRRANGQFPFEHSTAIQNLMFRR